MSLMSEAYAIGVALSEYEPGRVIIKDRALVSGVGTLPLAALILTPGEGDNSQRVYPGSVTAGMKRLLIEDFYPMDTEPDWALRHEDHLAALRAAFNTAAFALPDSPTPKVTYGPTSSANSQTTGTNLIRQSIRVERYER